MHLHIPADGKIAFFLDVEAGKNLQGVSYVVSSDCLKAYADTIEPKFHAGFYENPSSSDNFEPKFCAALDDKNVANAVLWPDEPELDAYIFNRQGSPNFNPAPVHCHGGTDSVWQYKGNGTYDADELVPGARDILWAP